jgi:hypothetical protein
MPRDQFLHLTCSMLCVAMYVFCSVGGANSAGQTRETYDPTYCSVKLPEPQPLAPMDAETVERYVGVQIFGLFPRHHHHHSCAVPLLWMIMLESLPSFILIFSSRLLPFSFFPFPSHPCFVFCQPRCYLCLKCSLGVTF